MADTSTSAPESGNRANESRHKLRHSLPLLLILATSMVVGTAAGGASVYFFLAPAGDDGKSVADIKAPIEEVKPYTYLPLDPILIQAIDDTGAQHAVTMILTLEIDDEDAEQGYYERLRPRVHDSILRSLHRPPMQLQPADGRLSNEEVKRRAAAAGAEVLGAGLVNAVLIQGAL